ncbi:MAG: HAMP domain-containing histidine kinase, partial [Verrucomicrobia bacterium]|nr:HAMP domain-containing histidine kinase [Verrucomicrobiota bacterium]
LSIALCSSGAFWLDRKSRGWLGLTGEQILAELRSAVIEISRTEPHPDKLIAEFQQLLRERCQTSFAALLFDRGEVHASGNLELAKRTPGHAALCESGWATPESLQRRRSTPSLADLRRFIIEHSLGLMVTVPSGSPTPSLLVALGTKTNQWPYTYPEVQRLQNIAELMDNILTRARLTAQAALKARMEHLAMMSRGLAHDLNNLITPISSFLVHTDGRSAAGSAEQEVHDAAKRSVRMMTEYVRQALFFANRLAPKFENIRLRDVFEVVRELSAPLAAHREVTISIAPAGDISFTADAVLVERLLVNLIANAIDASEPRSMVALSVGEVRPGWLRLQVADEGCGIPPENLSRVFDPYFTSKQFGDETRGFGLGLTICQKIVELHAGVISVQSEPGRGTTLTVDLPVTQTMPPLRPETAP